ncbi:MAG: methyltransferase domain-containing protein [Oscillospiraceae bacterium]|nr:methyltransferase domain-containing protein [Oscillospiraceae bacterium]
MNIFKCPKCGKNLDCFIPAKCNCGFNVPCIDGVYQFTNDSPIFTDGDGLKWLGYENVGENYEPAIALGSDNLNENISVGYNVGNSMFIGNCSRKLKEYLGDNCVVIDLGAGLGQASIPLALAGANTIAADISQKMLSVNYRRAKENHVGDNLICARMNAYKLEIADNSIDAVIVIDMLHQVNRPELVVEEIKRILKSSGVYVTYNCYPVDNTDEQKQKNTEFNEIQKDIANYYYSAFDVDPYKDLPKVNNWEKANTCISDSGYFEDYFRADSDVINEWQTDMRFALHKLKTRADGGSQLIPDEIHKKAWNKTEEYALKKYGEDYNNIKRHDKKMGFLDIYKLKQ